VLPYLSGKLGTPDPALDLGDDLPASFSKLITPASTHLFSPEDVRDNRKQWVDEWLDASTQ
jgi:thiamine transport system substrate-binding protein